MATLVDRTLQPSASAGGLKAWRKARKVSGSLTAPNTGGSWQLVPGTTLAIPAAVGDLVELRHGQMTKPLNSVYLDWAVVVEGVAVRYASSDTATPLAEGLPFLYHTVTEYRTAAAPFDLVVTEDDLDDDQVTWQLAVRAAGAGTLYLDTTYAMILSALNHGANVNVG